MISVIIPLYNKETSVEQSIRSVLNQSYQDFELIIVDDGSTDNSLDVVRRIQDDRIVIIEQENGGPSKARNTGVKHAKGDWIVFLDADDELLPDALQVMKENTERYPNADLVDFNKYLRVGGDLIPQEHPIDGMVKKPLRAWYYRVIAPGCGHSIYRRSFIQRYPYDERIRRFEDGDLLLRILPKAHVYSSSCITEIHDVNMVSASNPRSSITEDILGYLDFKSRGFWYRMTVYRFFLEERENYSEECCKLYPNMYKRYDLLLLFKILPYLKKFFYNTR